MTRKAKVKPERKAKPKLPKGYKAPTAYPKQQRTLEPSEFGRARAREVAEAEPDAIPAKPKRRRK